MRLNPDGVAFSVKLDDFKVGSSVFMPCINTTKAVKQVKRIANSLEMRVKVTIKIEDGRWGIRIWRTV